MADHKDGVQVYTSGISNLVTITAAGLAAGTALMQIAGSGADNKWWYLASLVAFFIGLIFCFLTMSGLTGQAKSEKPNIDVPNIYLPARISFGLACLGFILLAVGAFSGSDKKELKPLKLVMKLESCRSETGVTVDQRLKCYDSFFDSQVSSSQISNEELDSLPEKDRTWIKMLIIKSKEHGDK
ncbi:MAG: hypothetical protein NDI63_12295 [Pseudobdellovibrio sp.]|nr:hypothetical protein [Pseudobdellovibrio sp.]